MQSRMTAMKVLTLLASGMAAVAPSTPNAPTAANGGTSIAQAQAQRGQGMQTPQARTVAGSQIGIRPGSGGGWSRGYSDWSTFPPYNQRKARKGARRTGKHPIKKRYGR